MDEPVIHSADNAERRLILQLAVDSLRDNGQLVQSWITRFIVINGAMGSAVGAIIEWMDRKQDDSLVLWVLIFICVFGICSTILMALVTLRLQNWNEIFISTIKRIQLEKYPLYPKEPKGKITTTVFLISMSLITTVFWILLLVVVSVRLSHVLCSYGYA